jgi:predicted DNA binding CopG/RHH family protein
LTRSEAGDENKMPKIPIFKNEQEAAEWFATHDTASYMDELQEVQENIPVVRSRPVKKPVGLRIRSDYLEAVKKVAEEKGIPYQTLIQMWLVERLRQEAPELLHQK